jgi:hypothetical protein
MSHYLRTKLLIKLRRRSGTVKDDVTTANKLGVPSFLFTAGLTVASVHAYARRISDFPAVPW